MVRKLYFMFLILVLTSFVFAYEPHQQNQNFTFSLTVANSEECNLTQITYPDASSKNLNIEMQKVLFDFSANITSGNFSQTGVTCWDILCYDSDATPTYIDGTKCVEVNISGTSQETPSALINIILIIIFIGFILALFFINRKVDYEKWNKSIIKKYQNRNYIKLVFGSITYNIMKNVFVVYYLLGLPIFLLMTSLVYKFGIEEMVNIMKVFFGIYLIGVILISIYLFSNVQEWLVDLMEDVKNESWGMGQ